MAFSTVFFIIALCIIKLAVILIYNLPALLPAGVEYLTKLMLFEIALPHLTIRFRRKNATDKSWQSQQVINNIYQPLNRNRYFCNKGRTGFTSYNCLIFNGKPHLC